MGAQASSLASLDQSASAVGSRGRGGEKNTVLNFSKQLSIRRSKKRRNHERLDATSGGSGTGANTLPVSPAPLPADQPSNSTRPAARRMDKLRRSLRGSLRRRKDWREERELKELWQCDEKLVRDESCWFRVKYLGCVQVYESRGMQVCEDAIKLLRAQRRRTVRCMLHVSGQSLRVVADDTKDLLVDQTIEKVSFCAPDRTVERGFSYICRDGTTRRWMCHCFLAIGETGERLSHAVGCAFAVCLERKQQRDKDCSVSMSVDPGTSCFTRHGSFRQVTLTERLTDPQNCKPAEPVPVKTVENPFAVERPRAPASLFTRQGSLRVRRGPSEDYTSGVDQQTASPFKRQLSLRLDQLPSNVLRQRQLAPNLPSLRPSAALRAVEPIFELSDHDDSESCDNVTLLSRHLNNGAHTEPKSNCKAGSTTDAADDWLSSVSRDISDIAAAPINTGTRSSAFLDSTATSTCSSQIEGAVPSPLPATQPPSASEISQWPAVAGQSANNPFLDPSSTPIDHPPRITPTELAVKTFELTM